MFESDKFVLIKNKMFIRKGFANSRMFKLNVINEMSSTSAYLMESCDLWHSRLGHVHYNKVKHMSNLGLINNLADLNNEKCIVCNKCKVTRTSLKSVEITECARLDIYQHLRDDGYSL